MVLGEGADVRDVYRIAAERGVRIRRLNYRRDSLEDIFLKAMENGNGPKLAENRRPHGSL